jgi:hypothetical protein
METQGRFQRAAARAPELVLDGEPVTFAPPTLPGHRMLRLQIRNVGSEPAVLHRRDLELLDDDDEPLRASIAFGRAHSATTGSATVSPGEVLSLDFAWRARPDAGLPARVRTRGTVIDLLPVHALHDVGERDRFA